jgi:uncharacterized protein (TIGR02172 family)
MPDQVPDKDALLGTGFTSDVYAWGKGRVLKLFHPGRPASRVHCEFTVTRVIRDAGLSAPAAYDLVELDGRLGIIFERIDGPSLADLVQARPWTLFAVARQFAELHAVLHSHRPPDELPHQYEWIDSAIQAAGHLSDAEKLNVRSRLADLPHGDALCHGDFHPGNILCSKSGPVIIDWGKATRGHPLGDVAQTSYLFQNASLPPSTPRTFRLLFESLRAILHRTYLKRYLQLRSGTLEQIAAWKIPVETAVVSRRREAEARK